MKIGDKIVCVDNRDVISSATGKRYRCPLIKGNVYVVESVEAAPDGQIGVVVLGVILNKEWGHRVFYPWRFRLLDHLKELAAAKQQAQQLR